MTDVKMLISEDCDICSEVKRRLEKIILEFPFASISYLVSDESNTAAIDFAIEYDVSEIPTFVIGDMVFSGEDWSAEDVKKALLMYG